MEQMEWQEKLRTLSAGELTPDEAANVLREAAESETKQAELQFSQKLTTVLKERDLFEVKGIVAGLILEEGLPAVQPSSWLGKLGLNWILSLSLFLLLGTGVFLVGKRMAWWAVDPQALAQQYLQPMENVIYLEDNEAPAIEDLRLGMAAYDQQSFRKAAKYLTSYCAQVQDGNAGLFLAICHLMEGEADQATPILLYGLQKPGPIQEASRWYLALAYLQKADTQAAINTLEAIPDSSIYGSEAQELLESLRGEKK
jgi:hypothetical protein